MATPSLPRVCLIGAGSSGMPVIKALAERGFDFDCFEASNEIGGNWCYRNANGMSAAYESLHINTHAGMMQYTDFPMPADTPDFPSHAHIKAYFDDYVDHFDLRKHITFETSVTHARRLDGGGWAITTAGAHTETDYYDALIVANGHHWDPRWPATDEYPGQFDGEQIHAHSYMTPNEPIDFAGRNVLVVGMGNSAMDIATELSRPGVANTLYLSSRHGHWVMPKYAFGLPITDLPRPPHWAPWWLTSLVIRAVVGMTVGAPQRYGLQKPDHRILSAHPTVSSDFLQRVGSGDIMPRPGIQHLDGDRVQFADGREDTIDAIIWATGYNVCFPFFDPDFLQAEHNHLPRWQQMVVPEYNDLFFVGLMQPLGAVMPFAEKQAGILGDHLLGKLHFPDADSMRKDMATERAAMTKRYGRSPRHTMQVDNEPYHHRLDQVRNKGEKRAAKQDFSLPVPRHGNEGQRPPSAA